MKVVYTKLPPLPYNTSMVLMTFGAIYGTVYLTKMVFVLSQTQYVCTMKQQQKHSAAKSKANADGYFVNVYRTVVVTCSFSLYMYI